MLFVFPAASRRLLGTAARLVRGIPGYAGRGSAASIPLMPLYCFVPVIRERLPKIGKIQYGQGIKGDPVVGKSCLQQVISRHTGSLHGSGSLVAVDRAVTSAGQQVTQLITSRIRQLFPFPLRIFRARSAVEYTGERAEKITALIYCSIHYLRTRLRAGEAVRSFCTSHFSHCIPGSSGSREKSCFPGSSLSLALPVRCIAFFPHNFTGKPQTLLSVAVCVSYAADP